MTVGILNFPKENNQLRYLFFEMDRKDKHQAFDIIWTYNKHNLSCYVHDSGKGYHFLNLMPLPKYEHAMILKELRLIYDSRCPYNTLRVKANKWKEEITTFQKGVIVESKQDDTTNLLYTLKRWIDTQSMPFIEAVFNTVHYPLVVTKEEMELGL